MDQLQRLLQESIACYRKLMEIYDRLRDKLSSGGPTEKLEALIDQSRELYKVVQFVDIQFKQLAAENQVPLDETPLYLEWKTLMGQVREENKLIRRQLLATMALLKEDIDRIGQSRKVISGYRSGKEHRGQRIDVFSG